MPRLNGKGPQGDGRSGRGVGRCVNAKQAERCDNPLRSGINQDTNAALEQGGGRGSRRRRGSCRRRNGKNFNVESDEAI